MAVVIATESDLSAVAWLRTPAAIRKRCQAVFDQAADGSLKHFGLELSRLDPTADYVLETIRANYPTLDIPYHSRWRHFVAAGVDRWQGLSNELRECGVSQSERARIRTELVIISVLLDAGAGSRWRYLDPLSSQPYGRSEGLALASFDLYHGGAFSNDREQPHSADATQLADFQESALTDAFQVTANNPLIGVRGRTELLRQLGHAVGEGAEFFGPDARLGNLYDYLAAQAKDGRLPAASILSAVLASLSSIWPGRLALGGMALGDVWPHYACGGNGPAAGLVPFHKLSQWLSYSLVEPLEESGITVTDLDALTGLPEYRNGGLFLDLGVLVPKYPELLSATHSTDSETIVEWRALTVILLDKLAERIRRLLDRDSATLPLAKVLEGGSWSAGRRIARQHRDDGTPPLKLHSDGTVF